MIGMILAIDPGASGGMALSYGHDRTVTAEPMRGTLGDIYSQIRGCQKLSGESGRPLRAVIENVGFHRPGNSAVASCKFARHVGNLEAFLLALGIPTTQVTPPVWMRIIGTVPADKTKRKNAIKDAMQRQYPKLHVTLATADALGILTWAVKQEEW